MANILVVDDEREMVNLMELCLHSAGYATLPHYLPEEILDSELEHVDLAVMGTTMPQIDGFALCQEMRNRGYTFPIIMLTAQPEDHDRVNDLSLGVDGYLLKPFHLQELIERIGAHLHNEEQEEPSVLFDTIVIDDLCISETAHSCTLAGEEITLTPTEFQILLLLCKNRGRVLSGKQIFEEVWQEPFLNSANTVMVHMQKLRRKLKDTEKRKRVIQTVWGVGYKIG